MRISLIITADDIAGYAEGLPALLKLLDAYKIKATFLFSLGYDNTGLRVRHLFRPKQLSSQLPFSQKLRGTLLFPTHLSKKYLDTLKACQQDGHELGVRSFDSVNWQLQAMDADNKWTRQQLEWSIERFSEIFNQRPLIHSASGQIINPHLLSLQEELGFTTAIDTRGLTPYLPRYHDVTGNVINLPFTLPSIEELLVSQTDDITLENVHGYLLVESQKQLPQGHFYEVRAAYEGRQWLPVLEKMIVMWRSLNWEFCTVSEIYDSIKDEHLLTHQVGWASYQPGNRYLATQGLPIEEESSA